MEIGDKIRKARENKNLGRDYLAAQLDMDKRTLEKIENNQRDVHLKEVVAIAKELELTPEELLFGEPKLVFEHCNHNGAVYNSGTVNFQSLAEVRALYESVISRLEKVIAEKDITIADKDTIIKDMKAQQR